MLELMKQGTVAHRKRPRSAASGLPHSAKVSPWNRDTKQLFGRDREVQELVTKLSDGSISAKYFLVMGSAGLGKTETVKAAARLLIAQGESHAASPAEPASARRSFSAIVFVELRSVFNAMQVETAVEKAVAELQEVGEGVLDQPASRVALLQNALLILDNADDPYEKSCTGSGGEKGWFEGSVAHQGLLDKYEGCFGWLLLTIRDEARKPLFNKRSISGSNVKLKLCPLMRSAGEKMLKNEMGEVKLTKEEEETILSVCGRRGVSPLALSIVCGVLRRAFEDDLCDRQEYLTTLSTDLGNADTEFAELQLVMKHSIEKVNPSDRAAFLKLHLFPDRFSQDYAAALWGLSDTETRKTLIRLKDAALLDYCNSAAQPFLVLDHVWYFATTFAEDPNCPWLTRSDFADATTRLIKLAITRKADDDRLLSAATFHAQKCLRLVERRVACEKEELLEEMEELLEEIDNDDSDEEPMAFLYRSLAGDAPAPGWQAPYRHRTGEPRQEPSSKSQPLSFADISPALRDAARELTQKESAGALIMLQQRMSCGGGTPSAPTVAQQGVQPQVMDRDSYFS